MTTRDVLETRRTGAPTTILGLNVFHADSAACIVRDGRVVAAIAEERLNRVKHFAGFPELAIRQCLDIAGVDWHDIDAVAVGRSARANRFAKLGYAMAHPLRIWRLARKRVANRRQVAGVGQLVAEACDRAGGTLRGPALWPVEHHVAHAASAFFVSPFDSAAVLSIDGFGDFASTLVAVGNGPRLRVLERTLFPHSLGILYSAICQFIGFDRYGDEGKVMGLAPYGEPVYQDFFDSLVRLGARGRFRLGLDSFIHHTEGVDYTFDADGRPHVAPLYSKRLVRAFGPPRDSRDELTPRDVNLAASLQQCLERAYFHILRDLHARTGLDSLCLAGGVALNSVANGKVFEETPFQRLYTQPAAGDDGTAVGAAMHAHHVLFGGQRGYVMDHAYLGPAFSEDRIRSAASAQDDGVTIERRDDETLCERTAEALATGKVVGWFQGAAEWGPRALGNRSILTHPGWPGMKDVLNARVKHREPFRPFAPSVLEERTHEYFHGTHPSPFMMLVYRTRPAVRHEIAAVNHVDDTGRLQTVSARQNPLYHKLIEAFQRRTGLPIVLNTSFNESEPIVTTPEEALACFRRTRMDMLVMGAWCLDRSADEAVDVPASRRDQAA